MYYSHLMFLVRYTYLEESQGGLREEYLLSLKQFSSSNGQLKSSSACANSGFQSTAVSFGMEAWIL
jgi:hypothetical protein